MKARQMADVLALICVARAAAETRLSPLWQRDLGAGVEWVTLAPAQRPVAALALSHAGELRFLDTRTGAETARCAIEPGARFAGASEGVAYFASRSRVTAISLNAEMERWTAEVALNSPELEADDPEYLLRIVAARATPDGVVLARSDGALAELSRVGGSVRWRGSLGKAREAEIKGAHGLSALMWRSGPATRVALLDTCMTPPRRRDFRIEGEPPLWWDVHHFGAILVWRDRYRVCFMDGEEVARPLAKELRPRAADLAIVEEVEEGDGVTRAGPVMVMRSTRGACAMDVFIATIVWQATIPQDARLIASAGMVASVAPGMDRSAAGDGVDAELRVWRRSGSASVLTLADAGRIAECWLTESLVVVFDGQRLKAYDLGAAN